MNEPAPSTPSDRPSVADVARTRLRAAVGAGQRVVGVGVGCALTAQCAAAAGADVIGLYNSGPLRLAGKGSLAGLLATGNANQIVLDLAGQVAPYVGDTPMVAGLLSAAPARPWSVMFDELRALGVCGIQNSPTAGLVSGPLRLSLEETGLGFASEVDLIALAASAGLLTCAYVFTPDEGQAMVDAGVDLLVVHLGLTGGGRLGARSTVGLDEAAGVLDAFATRATARDWPVFLCCHGGPLETAEDFRYVADRVPRVQGFFGASVFERIPIERGVTDAVRAFKALEAVA